MFYDNINRSFYKYQTREDTTDGIQGFYNFQKIAQKVNPCCYEFSFQAWAHCKNFNLSRIISEISNNPLLNTSQKTNGTTEAKCTEYVYKQLFGLRYNKHNPLEKSFKKFLISKGIKESDIKQNCHFIDFVFIHKGKNYLCELKPSTQSQIKYAVRNAIGQLLEYEYKDNLIYDYKVIVFQEKTTKEEKLYLDHLKENHGLYFLTELKKGYFEGNLKL